MSTPDSASSDSSESTETIGGAAASASDERSVSPRKLAAPVAAVTALLVVGVASTTVQALTALALGTAQYFDWRWSTGGIFALAAAAFMWFKGTSWASWGSRIWPWLLATAVVAAVSIAAQPAPTAELPREPQFGFASQWVKVDVEAEYELVDQPNGTYLVDFSEIKVCYIGQPWNECVDDVIAEYDFACIQHDVSPSTPVFRYKTSTGPTLNACEITLDQIKQMQSEGGAGYTVATPGAEKLLITDDTDIERVQVAEEEAHVAVCYLGLLGECVQ